MPSFFLVMTWFLFYLLCINLQHLLKRAIKEGKWRSEGDDKGMKTVTGGDFSSSFTQKLSFEALKFALKRRRTRTITEKHAVNDEPHVGQNICSVFSYRWVLNERPNMRECLCNVMIRLQTQRRWQAALFVTCRRVRSTCRWTFQRARKENMS